MRSLQTSSSELPVQLSGGKILVAGRIDAQDGIVTYLRGAGCRVDVCYELPVACRMLGEGSYDAVVCDLSLPGGGGLALLETLSPESKGPPLIYVARKDEREDLLAALRAGAFHYLEPPFEPHDVLLATYRAIERHQFTRQHADDRLRWKRLEETVRRLNMARGRSDLLENARRELPPLLGVKRFFLYEVTASTLRLVLSSVAESELTEERRLALAQGTQALRNAVRKGKPTMIAPGLSGGAAASIVLPLRYQDEPAAVLVLEEEANEQATGAATLATLVEPTDEVLNFYTAIGDHLIGALRIRDRTSALEQALSDLEHTQGELLRAERIATVGKLAAGITHELKNPLTSMTFALRNLEDQIDQVDRLDEAKTGSIGNQLRESVAILMDDVVRMRDRISAFLSVARPVEQCLTMVNVGDTVRRVVERYRKDPRGTHIGWEEHFDPSAVCRVDEDQLFAATSNLVLNALEALVPRPQGHIKVSVGRSGGNVYLCVEDDGPGVPREDRERIFEVFYSTKRGGTGLGLSQVFVFAERSGGRAFLASSPVGARLVIELPGVGP